MIKTKNYSKELENVFQDERIQIQNYISKMITDEDLIIHLIDETFKIALSKKDNSIKTLGNFRQSIFLIASKLSIQHIKNCIESIKCDFILKP